MHRIYLFLLVVAVIVVLHPHVAHPDEQNPSLLGGASSQDTAPDIAGIWIAGDVGSLQHAIRRLDDGTGDYELVSSPGAGPKGDSLRLKWSAKDHRFTGERASIDGKRRSITLIELDDEDLKVTRTFDEESLKDLASLGPERPFPHVQRWKRFTTDPVPDADKHELRPWELEIQTLIPRIAKKEAAAAAEAAAIRDLYPKIRSRDDLQSLLVRKAQLESLLNEIFSDKQDLDRARLTSVRARLKALQSQYEERAKARDRIVQRRLSELLGPTTLQPQTRRTKARSFRVDLPGDRSVEFVGITGNTRPADEGWRPDGQPLEDAGHWPATLVEYGEDSVASFAEGGEHPEPAANAIDVLLRFEGLKGEPSLVFDWPTEGSAFRKGAFKDPYELRIATRWRERQSRELPRGSWSAEYTWRIGFTDEDWGRFVRINKDGSVSNPIQPMDTFADSYQLIQVVGAEPREELEAAVFLRLPKGNTDPGNPLHRFALEMHAVDSHGERRETTRSTTKNPGEYAYTLLEPLPPGRTLSHFEYRLRPYRYWVTFMGVAMKRGERTTPLTSFKTFESARPRLERNQPVEMGAILKHDRFAWQYDSKAIVATGKGSGGDQLHLWKLNVPQPVHEPIGQQPHAYSIATSRGSSLVVAGTNTGTVLLWDTGSRQLIRTIEPALPAPYTIYAVAISPDDSRIAACGTGGTIFVYDQQGKVTGRIDAGKDRFLADLQFSPDGKMLAGVDDKGRVTLWSFPAGTQIEDWPDLGIASNSALQWSESGDRLALVSAGFVALVEPRAESEPQTIVAPESICLMIPKAFLEGKVPGNYLVQAGFPDGVQYVGATALAPDFQTAATVQRDGSLAFWDTESKIVLAVVPAPPGCLKFDQPGQQLKRLAYSPTGAIIAAITEYGSVVYWPTAEPTHWLRIVAPDGKTTAVDHVVRAQVGLNRPPPHDWIGWLDQNGLVDLTDLPIGRHILLTAAAAPTRSLFQLHDLPVKDSIAELRLTEATLFTSEMLDVKAKVNSAPGQDDTIVLQIHNLTQKELRISERDLELQTEIPLESHANEPQRYLRVRGLSPRWLAGRGPPGTIDVAPGKSSELSINWREWFNHGYWSSRDHEVAAEPALLPPADGQLLVRVCIGGTSAMPVQVTIPKSAQTAAGDPKQPQPRDQAIHPQGEIRGQLLDEAGKPVSGATVACGAFINESGGGGTRDVTDAEGRFRLLVPSPGIYIVFLKELKRDRELVVVADDSVLVEAGRITTSRLTLSTGRKVSGTVVDGEGKPVGALRVRYYSPAAPNSIGGGQTVHTNDQGEFEFFVPPGRLSVHVFFAGPREDIQVAEARVIIPADGEVPPLRLPLKLQESKFGDPAWVERSTPGTKIVRHENAADVTGIVVDEQDAPQVGAKVFREGSPIVVTDKDGRFRMPIEKGTQFVMHAFAPGHRVWFGTPTAGDELKIVLEKKDAK